MKYTKQESLKMMLGAAGIGAIVFGLLGGPLAALCNPITIMYGIMALGMIGEK